MHDNKNTPRQDWVQASGGTSPALFLSPCIIHRYRNPAQQGANECALQYLLCAEQNGMFSVSQLDFDLARGTYARLGPEAVTPIARDLTAANGIALVYAALGEALVGALRRRETVPQVLRGLSSEAFGSTPLSAAADALPVAEHLAFRTVFDRLSSRWGQKAAPHKDLPRPRKLPAYPAL